MAPCGKEIWEAAGKASSNAGHRSANAMRFYALSRMLAEAETAAMMGSDAEAARQLRELQAHAEQLVTRLAAGETGEPDEVAA